MPPSDEESVAELRAQAARARRHARDFGHDEVGERLKVFADELEARALALEAETKT
jgi:hypothetical protein